tara:strand:+ start:23367 stop:26828 length:3462 start_codon:yes stop_codon:yes gene_type:complete
MPHWKQRNKSSITNKTTIFGNMAGIISSKRSGVSSFSRANTKNTLPADPEEGFLYMKNNNMLSKNPVGSGGVGVIGPYLGNPSLGGGSLELYHTHQLTAKNMEHEPSYTDHTSDHHTSDDHTGSEHTNDEHDDDHTYTKDPPDLTPDTTIEKKSEGGIPCHARTPFAINDGDECCRYEPVNNDRCTLNKNITPCLDSSGARAKCNHNESVTYLRETCKAPDGVEKKIWKYGIMGNLDNGKDMIAENMHPYDSIMYSYLTLVKDPDAIIPPTIEVGDTETDGILYDSYHRLNVFDLKENMQKTRISKVMEYCCANDKKFIWVIGGKGDTKNTPQYKEDAAGKNIHETYITNFVDNCMRLLKEIGGDGIDFHWEYMSDDPITRDARISGLAKLMVSLKIAICGDSELRNKVTLSYTGKYNAFFNETHTRVNNDSGQGLTAGEGLDLFTHINYHGGVTKYNDATRVISHANIMMYDIDARDAFVREAGENNPPSFILKDYKYVLDAWGPNGGNFNKNQIIMGFDAGWQIGVSTGRDGLKDVMAHMLEHDYTGGIMLRGANDTIIEFQKRGNNYDPEIHLTGVEANYEKWINSSHIAKCAANLALTGDLSACSRGLKSWQLGSAVNALLNGAIDSALPSNSASDTVSTLSTVDDDSVSCLGSIPYSFDYGNKCCKWDPLIYTSRCLQDKNITDCTNSSGVLAKCNHNDSVSYLRETCKAPAGVDKKQWRHGVMGYLENWKDMDYLQMHPYDVILYSFLTLVEKPDPDNVPTIEVGVTDTDGTIYDSYHQKNILDFTENWEKTRISKVMEYCCAHNKKFIWAIGGWSDTKNTPQYSHQTYITNFVTNCVRLLKEVGGDGIDFDWEHFSDDLTTRDARIKGLADIMIKLKIAICGDTELNAKGITISYTPRYNAFFDNTHPRAKSLPTEGEGLDLFKHIKELGGSTQYNDPTYVINHGNIMMYDIDARQAFTRGDGEENPPSFILQDYQDVFAAWGPDNGNFKKDQIIMGFEPAWQPGGGVHPGREDAKDVIAYMADQDYTGGIMFWAANDVNVEFDKRGETHLTGDEATNQNWVNSAHIAKCASNLVLSPELTDCSGLKDWHNTTTGGGGSGSGDSGGDSSSTPSSSNCGTWNEICPNCSGTCGQCSNDPAKWQCYYD